MVVFLKKYRYELILILMVILYSVYFSFFTIIRHQRLLSAYYDLGIMDQTVYNTYRGRFLELTDPVGDSNIKRMAIHNDILLALLAPFYFIHQGPETLLVLQSVILALGAIPLYWLVIKVLKSKLFGLIIAFSYLLYPPLQRANIFDFHAVTLATSLLLFMFYFAYVKKYFLSFIFFILAVLSKENVTLTTAMFGLYLVYKGLRVKSGLYVTIVTHKSIILKDRRFIYGLMLVFISIFWFILSIWIIIPHFRHGYHFAISLYTDFGESPGGILKGLVSKPRTFLKDIFHIDTLRYFLFLFAPVSFLAFFAPQYILIASPEFAINLLSSSGLMRSILFHYTALITSFVFIAAIFGAKRILEKAQFLNPKRLSMIILLMTLVMSYLKGPLPYSKESDVYPFIRARPEQKDVSMWKNILKDENLIISATEHLGPHFSQRKILYRFSDNYKKVDYVLILTDDVYNDWLDKEKSVRIYEQLIKDNNFKIIYKKGEFEVYKKTR